MAVSRETLSIKEGDCEDRAFLLASMLLASGISGYSIRLAFGKIYQRNPDSSSVSYDHVWVMYKSESGVWLLLEPLVFCPEQPYSIETADTSNNQHDGILYEYIPYYVLNADHLWTVSTNIDSSSDTFRHHINNRTFWTKFTPAFAASIHNNIFDSVLSDMGWFKRNYIKAVSLAMDSVERYDPREHFDNGYIVEGWQLLQENLKKKTLDGLARSCHAIADFYSHTSYAHFAKISGNGVLLYDGSLNNNGTINPGLFNQMPDYSSGPFNLNDLKFSLNTSYFQSNPVNKQLACDEANKRVLISGRFAQPGDSSQTFPERNAVYIPYVMRNAPDFPNRALLPHHNEIAVDDTDKPSEHKLYNQNQYANHFEIRKNTAMNHMKLLYSQWKKL